jgi:heme o synthase
VLGGVVLLAVAMGSGAAGAINMWYDADIDAIMSRTSTRPIPAGRLPRDEALGFGVILSGASVLLIWMASTTLAALLLAGSILYYGVLYTMWLKRRTPQNIVIGGAAGAFPPVIGWAAVSGTAPLDAWLLFALVFMWTPPHFWALSLNANRQYAEAGIPMLPVTHGAASTRRHIVAYSVAMVAVSLVPVLTGLGGLVYLVVTGGLGLVFLGLAIRVAGSRAGEGDASPRDKQAASHLFAFSIVYLFLIFSAVIVEHGVGVHMAVMGMNG